MPFQRYDKRDVTRAEMWLIRAVHHELAHHRQENRNSPSTVAQETAFWGALEIIFEAKRQVKAEIKQKSAERWAKYELRLAA